MEAKRVQFIELTMSFDHLPLPSFLHLERLHRAGRTTAGTTTSNGALNPSSFGLQPATSLAQSTSTEVSYYSYISVSSMMELEEHEHRHSFHSTSPSHKEDHGGSAFEDHYPNNDKASCDARSNGE